MTANEPITPRRHQVAMHCHIQTGKGNSNLSLLPGVGLLAKSEATEGLGCRMARPQGMMHALECAGNKLVITDRSY